MGYSCFFKLSFVKITCHKLNRHVAFHPCESVSVFSSAPFVRMPCHQCVLCALKFAFNENALSYFEQGCDFCDMAFSQSRNLKGHKRSHTGEKPFDCPTCHKTFRLNTQMKVHGRIHTGDKLRGCPKCDKAK